tara:strand:+ start:1294 stop:2226 length:933 start_codon:yes stop_codon:yes gene_type:complete
MNTNIRFYKEKYPNEDELVMCEIFKIDDRNGIFVKLLEYNNVEAMINFRDASSSRVKNIKKIMQINSKLPLLVIRVDREKGNIDLSNKYIDNEEKNKLIDKYHKYKKIHNIFHYFCSNIINTIKEEDYKNYFIQEEIDDLVYTDRCKNKNDLMEYFAKKTIWKYNKKECYNRVIDIKLDPSKISEFDLNKNEEEKFLKSINKYIHDIRYEITCCFKMIITNEIDSTEFIKNVYTKINNLCSGCKKVEIKIVNCPIYSISFEDNNEGNLTNKIKIVIEEIKKYITENNNLFEVDKIYLVNNLNDSKVNINI